MKYVTTVNGTEYLVELLDERHVIVNGKPYEINFVQVGSQPVYSLLVDGISIDAHVYQEDVNWQVSFQGRMYDTIVEDEREKRLRASLGGAAEDQGEFHLKAPMPGLVVAIPVETGQAVQKGDVLLILESMKMQNELKSPRAGIVSRVKVSAGERVEKKDTLLSVV